LIVIGAISLYARVMPAKEFTMPEIGTVKLFKRRGAKAIRITLHHDNYVRVTLPVWLPYRAAVEFTKSKEKWIKANQKPHIAFTHGQRIGKRHMLRLVQSENAQKITTKLSLNDITVTYPSHMRQADPAVQSKVKLACLRVYKQEAAEFLPKRLDQLALQHGFTYSSVRVRHLKSRWGSCSPQGAIALNIFLVKLPWELIDYVILHELVHTRVLHHGSEFWHELGRYAPQPKSYRKTLKDYSPTV
jgi:predicted metal-dependent hydrolase